MKRPPRARRRRSSPRFSRPRDAEAIAEALDSLLGRVLERFGEATRRRAIARGRHPAISLGRLEFLRLLRHIVTLLGDDLTPDVWCEECQDYEVGSARFVDVGCGVGDKVVLAADLGFEAHGIEVDPAVVERALRTFRMKAVPGAGSRRSTKRRAAAAAKKGSRHAPDFGLPTIALEDALESDLSGFDVLYYFRPFADDDLQRQLERRIWEQARPGAFVLAVCGISRPPARFEAIKPPGRRPLETRLYRARGRVPEA